MKKVDNKIRISDSFTYSKLVRFTLPSILMMIVTSVYSVVDGVFVSNFVGEIPFAALNLIYPLIMVYGAFGFMLGTGGCALVAKYLGEQDENKAREVFSMIYVVLLVGSTVLSSIGILFVEQIAILLGSTEELLEDCVVYGTIMLIGIPAFTLQTSFPTFMVASGKPAMGMILALSAGVINIILDYVFIVMFNWGISGAAYATILGQAVGGIVPLVYYLFKRENNTLYFVKFKWDMRALLKSCTNGSSEMMTNLSMSIVNIIFNIQLMRFIGYAGVSAYGIIAYLTFVFVSTFIGYTVGVSPLISYNYGAQNSNELKSLYRKSVTIMISSSIVLVIIAEVFAYQLAAIFVSYDVALMDLTVEAIRLYSISYIFSSICIFASAFFTALNNGKISAFISFLRTLILQSFMLIFLPEILGELGLWIAIPLADLLGLIISVVLLKRYKKVYKY